MQGEQMLRKAYKAKMVNMTALVKDKNFVATVQKHFEALIMKGKVLILL